MDSIARTRPLPLAALAALRPKQWAKNVLLLPAIIFSDAIRSPAEWGHLGIAFVAFCLLSSTGYIFNDWRDIEADRRHPKKRFRPLASGELTERTAWLVMALAFLGALSIAWSLSPQYFVVALLYFATTLTYSSYFKHIVILDVMFLAACYLWRPVAGAVAIGVAISPWLLLCTAFLALFLGFNKRRGEIMLLEGVGGTRKSLDEYSPAMLSEFQAITTSGTIISYALYTVLGSPTDWLLVTLPFVLFGICRYIYLMDQKGEGAAPDETLLRDRPILVTCVLYLIVAVAVLVVAPRSDRHPGSSVERHAAP
ncbi:MAG: decaprenyl-phosphate phosphoribosyltransferase [Pseudomonadota bacterium]|nr:decaprenyl-phosphate phosphoribosyltransferase [Pseudomonadota bacterium]